jgi:hypothetical protein
MKHHDPLGEYDLTRFVATILKRYPPAEPKLPFDEAEWKRAEAGDRLYDARREAAFLSPVGRCRCTMVDPTR